MHTEANPVSLKSRIINYLSHEGFQKYFWNTGWLFIGRIASLVVSFFVTAFIVRSLGPANYGELSYAVSFISIFSFIATLGLDTVLYRDIIKYPERAGRYLGTALILRILAGAIGVITCLAFAFFSSVQGDVSYLLISILSLTFVFNSFSILGYEFQAKVQSKHLSIASFIILIALNALKIAAILSGKGVIYLALILLFEPILTGIVFVTYRVALYGRFKDWNYDRAIALDLLKNSWPMMLAGAFAVIYSRIDQIFIKHLLDASAVGFYDAAVRISEAWLFIPTIIVSSLFPAIINASKVSDLEYSKRLKRLSLLLFWIAIGIAIPMTVFAPLVISLLYGPAFVSQSTIILQIYVWGGVGLSVGALTTNYLIAENLRKAIFVSSLITMALNIALNMMLIPKYGIEGSAWATAISYAAVPLSILLFKIPRRRISSILKI